MRRLFSDKKITLESFNVLINVTETKNTLPATLPVEIDGPKGRDPTRYGDWERNGRAIDF